MREHRFLLRLLAVTVLATAAISLLSGAATDGDLDLGYALGRTLGSLLEGAI